MKSEENCRDWKTESEHEVNEHLKNNGKCHICRGDFIENSFVNWHPDPKFKGCHKECRERYTIPDEPEERKHGDENFEESREEFKEKFDQEDDDSPEERKFTEYGKPMWSRRDESLLEEMFKAGRSMKEIAIALRRTESAINAKIREEKIEQKATRY